MMNTEQATREGKCIIRKEESSSAALPETLTFYEMQICEHGLNLFGFLLPKNEFFSYKEFAKLIEETYDTKHNSQNAEIVRILEIAHQHVLNLPERKE